MSRKPDIVSVGDARARAETPRDYWGRRDHLREAKLEEATSSVRKRPVRFEALPGPPAPVLPGLYGGEADEARRRRQAANKALEQAGLRPRPW